MLFLLRADESRYGQIFENMSKSAFSGRDEYHEMANGAYSLLVHTSIQFVEEYEGQEENRVEQSTIMYEYKLKLQ